MSMLFSAQFTSSPRRLNLSRLNLSRLNLKRTLGASAALLLLIGAGTLAHAEPRIRNGYVDNRYGQLHYTMASPATTVRHTPVAMIHQTVNASIESRSLFQELAQDRVVLAIDTPGYGNSDGPQTPVRIEDYAAAIAEGCARWATTVVDRLMSSGCIPAR